MSLPLVESFPVCALCPFCFLIKCHWMLQHHRSAVQSFFSLCAVWSKGPGTQLYCRTNWHFWMLWNCGANQDRPITKNGNVITNGMLVDSHDNAQPIKFNFMASGQWRTCCDWLFWVISYCYLSLKMPAKFWISKTATVAICNNSKTRPCLCKETQLSSFSHYMYGYLRLEALLKQGGGTNI